MRLFQWNLEGFIRTTSKLSASKQEKNFYNNNNNVKETLKDLRTQINRMGNDTSIVSMQALHPPDRNLMDSRFRMRQIFLDKTDVRICFVWLFKLVTKILFFLIFFHWEWEKQRGLGKRLLPYYNQPPKKKIWKEQKES